jgi:hypothetical protein
MRIHYRITPPAYFGLPSGNRIVLPADGKQRVVRVHSEDPLTRQRVFHGTLSEFRSAEAIFELHIEDGATHLHFVEDSLFASASEETSEQINTVHARVENVLRLLSIENGERVGAEILAITDSTGRPLPFILPRIGPILRTTLYSFTGLAETLQNCVRWSAVLDEKAERSLLYFEHGCLLLEHADTLPSTSWHTAFSRSMAFLQLFKALTTLIGDPQIDRDYQSRCRSLGLPKDYWRNRVKPLYVVRSDRDVAHHSQMPHQTTEFLGHYSKALEVLKEVLHAHLAVRASAHSAA